MNDRQLDTLDQLQAFLDGTMAVDFAVAAEERYHFIARTLQRFSYRRQRKRYPYQLMMTPYEKLKSLAKAEQFLKPGITFEQLDIQAGAMSDNEAAQRLNDVHAVLVKTVCNRSKKAA